jgi:predicted AlkP superfamily pyrophosphatase or phosphodiesterase
MNPRSVTLLACFAVAVLACTTPTRTPAPAPPRLLVLIGIDQFRAGYLDDYAPAFDGGFARLMREGRYWSQAQVAHAPTLSYPGHATLATGTHPKHHGFTSNAWAVADESGEKQRVFVALDQYAEIVGHPDLTGLSPRNLTATGIADWVRDADSDARAVAVSTGPGLALIYAGRALEPETRNHAYWLSSKGEFVTSTYFRRSYPEWVEAFNRRLMPTFASQRVWETTVPSEHRTLARSDEAAYEGDGVSTTFPHAWTDALDEASTALPDYDPIEDPEAAASFWRWFYDVPLADEALFALAREAVVAEALGQRTATDLLSIAIKSTDRIGHDYGPRSQEQLDVLVRLDRLLGTLFEFLDATVGDGKWTVAVSADHGAQNIVEYEIEQGRSARRVSEEEIEELLDRVARFVEHDEGPSATLAERLARLIEDEEWVDRAMTPAELAGEPAADDDPILAAYRNSYIPGRETAFPLWTRQVLAGEIGPAHPANWGIVVEFSENAQLWTAPSTHMSAHRYDREVPIAIMGAGVTSGPGDGPARTVDVAPTLAALARIDVPETVDGVVLAVD